MPADPDRPDRIDSSEDLLREVSEIQGANDLAGTPPAEKRKAVPPWVKWVILADAFIVVAVLVYFFAA